MASSATYRSTSISGSGRSKTGSPSHPRTGSCSTYRSHGTAFGRLPTIWFLGGIFCCYLPTVPQVQTVRQALGDTHRFSEMMTFEMLMREWAVEGRSVRPEHRMIGHTGFITVARKVSA